MLCAMIGASGSRHLARRRGSSPAVNPLLAAVASSARRLSTQREENESDIESGGHGGRKTSTVDSDGRRESRVSFSVGSFLWGVFVF